MVPRSRRKRGFTLIEILISVAVLSIITAVAVPSFIVFNRRQQLDQAAKQVKTDLRAMQAQAVAGAGASQWAVSFVSGELDYSIGRYEGGSLADPQTKDLPGSTTLSTTATVVFERLTGVPTGGQQVITVALGGDTRSVTVYEGGNME